MIPATTLRHHLADALKAIEKSEDFFLITKKDKPVSVMVDIDFFEDLMAAASPGYLKSVQEARADCKAKRLLTHSQVFGKL
jgi:PHD/YefM family antitoxin component YafN of YafNO toxin-antitoxin module